jgi:predicted O-methyltransferase YrrM
VVEIGSYLGRSTTLLGLALQHAAVPAARLVAIDPHTGDRQNMRALGISTIPTLDLFRVYTGAAGIGELLDVRVATSAAVAADWDDPVDLLFVDGWHSKQGVLADARGFGPHLTDSGIVCFDDYTHYQSVRRGVDLACTELGLVRYGTVAAQMWAGRPEVAPAGVARALRVERLVSAARGLTRRG